MTFAKRLRIAALVPAIAGLILAGVLFESHRALGGLEEQERTVYRIGVAFSELHVLARVYMAHHAERPRQQFLLAHDEISGVLASLAVESPQYGPPLKDLAETSDVTKRLFLKLVATYERHETVRNEALLKEAEERLGGRLLIYTRQAVNVASLLVDRISHDIVASQRRIYVLTSAFLAAAVIALGLVLHGLTRRLAGSLERVQKGIRMIGGGNLDHRIRLGSSDELGELANAFDRMCDALQATTVSRDELAVEVAERKMTEEALRAAKELAESEGRFRTLVHDLPVGVFIVQAGRIVFQNLEQKRLFGPIPEGLDIGELRDIHPEDADKFAQLCETARSEEGGTLELDLRFFPHGKSREGFEMRWTRVRTSPIEYLGRRAVLVSTSDVTRAREMEQLARVREKMASLGHVAAGIAHEIRNPLSGINIYVSALEHVAERSEDLDPEDKEKIRNVIVHLKSASNKIATVVQRVMEFAKPDAPRLDRVDLNTAIAAAIQLSSVALRKKGTALSTTLSPDLPLCLADLRLIEQVILNLLNNAAQAMEGMEGARRIEISSGAEEGRILIRVADSGPGIPPPLREKIFDPFFTTRKDGYGIGLSFSHRVITDHGGSLTAGTSRWGGAEFRIELPVPAGLTAGPSGTTRW